MGSNTILNNLYFGIISKEKLAVVIKQQQQLGENIVLVNGCFDILHAGHIHYLEKAKSFGDRLVVAVNEDQSIRQLKGDSRPINNLEQRMEVLAGLRAVDWVVSFAELRPGKIIETLNPNILVKTKEAFKTIKEIPDYEGASHVIKNGGKIYLLDRPIIKNCNISSTKIIEKISGKVGVAF